MDSYIANVYKHSHVVGVKNTYRRLMADILFAWLTNLRVPSNRGERRVQAKRLRRMATARRGEEREIREKRAWRAWQKARRLARPSEPPA